MIEVLHDEMVAFQRTCKVLEGIYGDDRTPPDIRQFGYQIRTALAQFMGFMDVKEDENESGEECA